MTAVAQLPERHKPDPVEAGTGRCGAGSPEADIPSGRTAPWTLSPCASCMSVSESFGSHCSVFLHPPADSPAHFVSSCVKPRKID